MQSTDKSARAGREFKGLILASRAWYKFLLRVFILAISFMLLLLLLFVCFGFFAIFKTDHAKRYIFDTQ